MATKTPRPTNIKLHKKSRSLEISFDDGKNFNLSCEYLRVHSPSAEVRGHAPGQETLQIGKQNVSIDHIEAAGNYAIVLFFDDGHSTGIYSWETLYDLGENHDRYWGEYLKRLEAAGHPRKTDGN